MPRLGRSRPASAYKNIPGALFGGPPVTINVTAIACYTHVGSYFNANPTFESGTSPWTANGTGVSIAQSSTWAANGTYSLELTGTGAAANLSTLSEELAYSSGTATIAVTLYSPQGGYVACGFNYFVNGIYEGGHYPASVLLTAGVPLTLTTTDTPSTTQPGTTSIQGYAQMEGTPPSSTVMYADNAYITMLPGTTIAETPTPAAVDSPASLPTSALTVTAAPAAVHAAATLPTPTVTATVTATPAAFNCATALPTPTVSTTVTVSALQVLTQNANSTFESGTSPWASGGTGVSIAQSSAWSESGTYSLEITTAGTSASCSATTEKVAYAGGIAIFTAMLYSPQGCTVQVGFNYFNSGGTYVGGPFSSAITLPAGQAQAFTWTEIPSSAYSTTASVSAVVEMIDTPASTVTLFLDNAYLTMPGPGAAQAPATLPAVTIGTTPTPAAVSCATALPTPTVSTIAAATVSATAIDCGTVLPTASLPVLAAAVHATGTLPAQVTVITISAAAVGCATALPAVHPINNAVAPGLTADLPPPSLPVLGTAIDAATTLTQSVVVTVSPAAIACGGHVSAEVVESVPTPAAIVCPAVSPAPQYPFIGATAISGLAAHLPSASFNPPVTALPVSVTFPATTIAGTAGATPAPIDCAAGFAADGGWPVLDQTAVVAAATLPAASVEITAFEGCSTTLPAPTVVVTATPASIDCAGTLPGIVQSAVQAATVLPAPALSVTFPATALLAPATIPVVWTFVPLGPFCFVGTETDTNTLGGAVTDTNLFGGAEVETNLYGGGYSDANAGFGATLDMGCSVQAVNITLSEFNDETIDLAITNNSSAFDLTGYGLQVLLKTSPGMSDTDPSTAIFCTSGGSAYEAAITAVEVTNESGGLATLIIPHTSLENTSFTFWRCDVTTEADTQVTAVYGTVQMRPL